MAEVVPQDLSDLLGRPLVEEQVVAALGVVTALAKSYCRARWADDDLPEDVAAVVKGAVLRLVVNPGGYTSVNMGGISVTHGSTWDGWTLADRLTLNRYRATAR